MNKKDILISIVEGFNLTKEKVEEIPPSYVISTKPLKDSYKAEKITISGNEHGTPEM